MKKSGKGEMLTPRFKELSRFENEVGPSRYVFGFFISHYVSLPSIAVSTCIP